MNPPIDIVKPLASSPQPKPLQLRLVLFTVVVFAWFWRPLLSLAGYSLKSELHSHALLIPLIAAYLIWLKRDLFSLSSLNEKKAGPPAPASAKVGVMSRSLGWPMVLFLFLGLVALGIRFLLRSGSHVDQLAASIFAFVSFFLAGMFFFFGKNLSRTFLFPLLFLYWIVPFPNALVSAIEAFFQTTSAYAAHALFSLAGTPVIQDGMVFQLPGLTIRVAQECSGIRSSLVLFITSLLTGYMFLQSPWKRILLAFIVIPLGILRNAFRIFTIATLTIEVNPNIINSPLHHRGGPIFFALSLIPFFIILLLLRRSEIRKTRSSRGNEVHFEPQTLDLKP